jgi:hypothetical protein
MTTRHQLAFYTSIIATGICWPVQLSVMAETSEPTTVLIDTSKTAEPISPYIYGQFIEHLPNWHPWERYQDFYDETQIMGVIAQELGILYTVLETRLSEGLT